MPGWGIEPGQGRPRAEVTVAPVSEGVEHVKTRVGVRAIVKKGGRPRQSRPRMDLPEGFGQLRRGREVYTEELGQRLLEAYYRSAGSLLHACQRTGVAYHAACRWMDEIPDFRNGIHEVDRVIRDIVHQQFMERVLTKDEKNPAWKLAYFKKWFPEYVESKRSPSILVQVTDSLIRPSVIDTTARALPPHPETPGMS